MRRAMTSDSANAPIATATVSTTCFPPSTRTPRSARQIHASGFAALATAALGAAFLAQRVPPPAFLSATQPASALNAAARAAPPLAAAAPSAAATSTARWRPWRALACLNIG